MKLIVRRSLIVKGLIAVALLLAGCDSLMPPLITPAVPAATPVIPTSLATPISTIEQTAVEPTMTATLEATPAPTITPGPSPTMDPLTQIMVSQPARIGALEVAPDGRRAEVVIYDCIALLDDPTIQQSFELLRVVDNAEGKEYQIDSQLINCGGLGAFGLDILQWSADGRYLLYTPHREGGPDGGCGPWTRSIVAVDTVDWTRLTLDRAAVSPDEALLAGWAGRELVIFSIDEGEIGRTAATLPAEGISPPVWSPDGARLAYLQTAGFCPAPTGDSAVVLVDAATMASQVVAASVAPEFATVEWIDANRILITDAAGSRWELDAATGVLTLIP